MIIDDVFSLVGRLWPKIAREVADNVGPKGAAPVSAGVGEVGRASLSLLAPDTGMPAASAVAHAAPGASVADTLLGLAPRRGAGLRARRRPFDPGQSRRSEHSGPKHLRCQDLGRERGENGRRACGRGGRALEVNAHACGGVIDLQLGEPGSLHHAEQSLDEFQIHALLPSRACGESHRGVRKA